MSLKPEWIRLTKCNKPLLALGKFVSSRASLVWSVRHFAFSNSQKTVANKERTKNCNETEFPELVNHPKVEPREQSQSWEFSFVAFQYSSGGKGGGKTREIQMRCGGGNLPWNKLASLFAMQPSKYAPRRELAYVALTEKFDALSTYKRRRLLRASSETENFKEFLPASFYVFPVLILGF